MYTYNINIDKIISNVCVYLYMYTFDNILLLYITAFYFTVYI